MTTWDEISKAKAGTIFADWHDEGVRCLIMKGGSSLCAYLGVPSSHPLAGHGYDELPLDCHYGLTFAGEGHDQWPSGFYWYGWDYSHSGDYSDYYDKMPSLLSSDAKKWLVDDVKREIETVLYDFKKLVALAEKIKL